MTCIIKYEKEMLKIEKVEIEQLKNKNKNKN